MFHSWSNNLLLSIQRHAKYKSATRIVPRTIFHLRLSVIYTCVHVAICTYSERHSMMCLRVLSHVVVYKFYICTHRASLSRIYVLIILFNFFRFFFYNDNTLASKKTFETESSCVEIFFFFIKLE